VNTWMHHNKIDTKKAVAALIGVVS